jgi:hypothetical protein
MKLADSFSDTSLDDIRTALAGGTLTVYSVARPASADAPVDRSSVIATFTFASPAFGTPVDGLETPAFEQESVPAASVGTPGFARARMIDGIVVADFSAGPGNREIKFNEVSCSQGTPVRITQFRILEPASWPETIDYAAPSRPGLFRSQIL